MKLLFCLIIAIMLAKNIYAQADYENCLSMDIPNFISLIDNDQTNNYLLIAINYRAKLNSKINYRIGLGMNAGPIGAYTGSPQKYFEASGGFEWNLVTGKRINFYPFVGGRYEHFTLDSMFIYPHKYFNYLGVESGVGLKVTPGQRIVFFCECAISYGRGLERINNDQYLLGVSDGWYFQFSRVFELQIGINF
ncbi:MAG: hypothetical protein ABI729_03700 [Chitinophagales bacterium]